MRFGSDPTTAIRSSRWSRWTNVLRLRLLRGRVLKLAPALFIGAGMIGRLFAAGHALRRAWWRVSRQRSLGVRVMLHRDRKLLLIRHRYGGTLMLPGGGVDSRETMWAAARRELQEETGISACPLQLSGIYLHLADGRQDYVALFVGELPEKLPTYRPGPLSEIESVHVETADVRDERISPATRRRIAEILDGSPLSEWW